MSKIPQVVVVGATGLVGGKVLHYLAGLGFPANRLRLVASQQSRGQKLIYRDQVLVVEAIDAFDFRHTQLAFFAAGSDVSRAYAQKAVAAGNWVIDKSSCFRLDDTVPLVVPGVNVDPAMGQQPQLIAVPNCSTIPLVMALEPIARHYGLKRLDIATYQAVSGAGKRGLSDLQQQCQAEAQQQTLTAQHFQQPILHNVLAGIDSLTPSGYTKEELKLQDETRKILNLPQLMVNATAVRVPVFYGHCEAVSIETQQPVDLAKVQALLTESPRVQCLSWPEVPNPQQHAEDESTVWVGRLRQLPGDSTNRFSLWLMSHNVGRGAALTAVEIAQQLQLLGLS